MTNELTRRQLLSVGAAASVAALPTPGILAGAAAPAEMPGRKFYAILSLGRLGFQAGFPESLELTVKHGFEGLDPDPNYFASLGDGGLKRLLDDLRAKNLNELALVDWPAEPAFHMLLHEFDPPTPT